MADEEVQEIAPEADAEAQEAAPAPEPVGEAAPEPEASWRDTLPDDIKDWANKFDSPATALKSYRELEKKMGRSITLPGKDATPEEVQAFHKKLGVPASPADYKLELPEHLPEEVRKDPLSDPLLKEFIETSHANGKSPAQVQADLGLFYKAMASVQEQADAEQARLVQKADEDLTREWGSDKEANLTYARRAVTQFDGDARFKEFLDTAEIGGIAIGNHPEFVRFFAKVGRALAEDSVQLEPTEAERSSANDEAAVLREKRDEALRRGDRAAAQRFDEAERAVYERMGGNKPIVGTAGRAA